MRKYSVRSVNNGNMVIEYEVKKNHLYDSSHDDWEAVDVKIHKHHKGSVMCKGSDKILEFMVYWQGRLESFGN